MPGGKVGGKLSKQALFEDIDFKLYNDGDKTMAFITDKTRLPLWIKCLNDQYRKQDDKENACNRLENERATGKIVGASSHPVRRTWHSEIKQSGYLILFNDVPYPDPRK